MRSRRHFLVGGAAATLAVKAHAQPPSATPSPPPSPIVDDSGRPVDPPPPGFYPYRGVSGPGLPVTDASATGGWTSGGQGVRYQGPQTMPYPTLPWDNASSASA